MKKITIALSVMLVLIGCLILHAAEKKLTEREQLELIELEKEYADKDRQIKDLQQDQVRIIAIANYINGSILIDIPEIKKETKKERKKRFKKAAKEVAEFNKKIESLKHDLHLTQP